MAKSRKYYKRKRGYKFNLNKLLSQYTRAKLDVTQQVQWTASQLQWENNNTDISIEGLLTLSHDFPYYRQLYHSMKLRGILITCTPMPSALSINTQQQPNFNGVGLCGFLTQRDASNYQNVSESNNKIVLGTTKSTKYIYFPGGQTGYISTDNAQDFDGKFSLQTNGGPSYATLNFTFTFSLFITFKCSN